MLEIEALTYLRGRSIPGQFMIIDEAQNLTPLEVKTVVSRAGKDTKVVLTGDPYQIDSPYLDSSSNGLTYLAEKFKGQNLFAHITLVKSERSNLAGLAANLCTDSHLRGLVENGFKVVVVKDAVAAPGEEAYQAALVNYGLIANAVVTTDQAIKLFRR